MELERIKAAEDEAKRFLERAKCLREAVKRRDKNALEYAVPRNMQVYPSNPNDCPKESGALRRASLDLTRALAEMRKP